MTGHDKMPGRLAVRRVGLWSRRRSHAGGPSMRTIRFGGKWAMPLAALIAFASVKCGYGQTLDTSGVAITDEGARRVLELPIRVIDKSGNPVPEAKVTPWALRSSQGHGLWRRGDERS